jgi:sarcosine oxidase subunit beta
MKRVAVIGGGIIGSIIASRLSELGVKVYLFEAKYFTYGSTGRSTGSITAQQRYTHLVERALETKNLIMELKKKYQELGIPFAQRFLDDESPHIAIAFNEKDYEELKKLSEVWSQGGAEVREAEPSKVKEEFIPWIDENSFYKAFITPNDYKLMPFPFTWSNIAAARLKGAETYTYEPVVKVEIGDKVSVETGSGKKFEVDSIVVAAGARSIDIIKGISDDIKVGVKSYYAAGFVSEPFKYEMKPTIRVIKHSYRFTQTLRGEYIATIDNMKFENPEYSTDDSYEFLIKASTITVKLMPNMAYVNILRSWGAYCDYTDDGLPIVGWSPKYGDKVYYAFGFNDYGLSAGPSIAYRAAKEVADGSKDPALDHYRPTRR